MKHFQLAEECNKPLSNVGFRVGLRLSSPFPFTYNNNFLHLFPNPPRVLLSIPTEHSILFAGGGWCGGALLHVYGLLPYVFSQTTSQYRIFRKHKLTAGEFIGIAYEWSFVWEWMVPLTSSWCFRMGGRRNLVTIRLLLFISPQYSFELFGTGVCLTMVFKNSYECCENG